MLAAAAWAAPALADLSGFMQVQQTGRTHEPGAATVQQALAELLLEQRAEALSLSVRAEAAYDEAIDDSRIAAREAFLDWAPAADLELRLGRQVLTWGVSEYLYVNDVFPKNHDAFFTGAGFDRMKEPVDAAQLAWHGAVTGVEAVVSRARADRAPAASRFTAMAPLASAEAAGDVDHAIDAALKISANLAGWDLGVYAASFRSRERRYFVDAAGLRADQPRLAHAGVSLTGNAVGGVAWIEAGVRDAGAARDDIVDRHYFGSSATLLGGYSREVGQDVTASVQLELEAPLHYERYVAALAPGVRPADRANAIVHARVQAGWLNQTLLTGAQAFAGHERDTHLNPFARWSPADGWTLEAGANFFNGRPDTRFGAFDNDSNAYALGRYSF